MELFNQTIELKLESILLYLLSIKQFVKELKPIRTGIVVVGNTEYQAEEEVSPDIEKLLSLLT